MTKNVLRFITLAALFLSATALPAFAANECLTWSHPGQDVNTRTLQETVNALGFPEGAREKIYKKYADKVVQMSHIETVLDELGYADDRRKAVIDEFRKSKKQFWGFGGLKLLQLPPNVRQRLEVMTADRDTKEISAGYRLENFLYGKDKKAPCAVFQPAKGEPQTVTLNIIEVEHEGTIYTVEHSEICSNAGKKTRPAPTAKAPATPATKVVALSPSEPSFTIRAKVWKVKNTDFLKRIKGKMSREMTPFIDEGLKDESIEAYSSTGIVQVDLNNLNWSTASGSKLGRSNSMLFEPGLIFPADFGPTSPNRVSAPVKNGEAQVTVEPKIVASGSSHTLTLTGLPESVQVVHYGPLLHSCGEVTKGFKCGSGPDGEWYSQLNRGWQWNRYHFFVVTK